ncbi:MAG: hypothetical protein QOF88_6813 [Mycobacterium sp.]|jgi:hypothetical protein|nr:hypothetical protein [Pseudonocardiales bacterium]MDT5291924.1 hypothetical protein [Mycobacterium sp.]
MSPVALREDKRPITPDCVNRDRCSWWVTVAVFVRQAPIEIELSMAPRRHLPISADQSSLSTQELGRSGSAPPHPEPQRDCPQSQ